MIRGTRANGNKEIKKLPRPRKVSAIYKDDMPLYETDYKRFQDVLKKREEEAEKKRAVGIKIPRQFMDVNVIRLEPNEIMHLFLCFVKLVRDLTMSANSLMALLLIYQFPGINKIMMKSKLGSSCNENIMFDLETAGYVTSIKNINKKEYYLCYKGLRFIAKEFFLKIKSMDNILVYKIYFARRKSESFAFLNELKELFQNR